MNPLQHNPLIEKMKDNVPIAILGKEIGYTKYKTPHLTGGSSGSLVINDQKQAVAINYAGIPNDKETDSIQSFALVLRCNYGNYQYDVLSDEYFGGLL
ncbi:hypothetical protein FACS1894218_1930 [Bacilli bacterium]|nr:hypothetical protein FACS1894218_1930 [Bacilli bacterium]